MVCADAPNVLGIRVEGPGGDLLFPNWEWLSRGTLPRVGAGSAELRTFWRHCGAPPLTRKAFHEALSEAWRQVPPTQKMAIKIEVVQSLVALGIKFADSTEKAIEIEIVYRCALLRELRRAPVEGRDQQGQGLRDGASRGFRVFRVRPSGAALGVSPAA